MKKIVIVLATVMAISACGAKKKSNEQPPAPIKKDPNQEIVDNLVTDYMAAAKYPSEGDSKVIGYTLVQNQIKGTAPAGVYTCSYDMEEKQFVVPSDLTHPQSITIKYQRSAKKFLSTPAECSEQPENIVADEVKIMSPKEFDDNLTNEMKRKLSLDDLKELKLNPVTSPEKLEKNIPWNRSEKVRAVHIQYKLVDADKKLLIKDIYFHLDQKFLGILQVRVEDGEQSEKTRFGIITKSFFIRNLDNHNYP